METTVWLFMNISHSERSCYIHIPLHLSLISFFSAIHIFQSNIQDACKAMQPFKLHVLYYICFIIIISQIFFPFVSLCVCVCLRVCAMRF